jgi:diguanylate cyclase (GGDEF)-like protein
MAEMTEEKRDDFFSNPKVLDQYGLLQEIGLFKYIDSFQKEIRKYQNLLKGAADIFNGTTVDDIMDAAVWQISDQFLPAFIVFFWRPFQNRKEVVMKEYKNYKMLDLSVINIESLEPFEHFFREYPRPINYDLLTYQMADKKTTSSLDKIRPELVVPIFGHSSLYGLILVGPKILYNEYTSEELTYLGQLMGFVSQAIQNHLHYEHSVRDVKTGLFNHGFFMSRLNEELARTKRVNVSASIIVIDVDKFKNFNDTYGHLAGDRVLEYIALAIKSNIRLEDIPSRFGGEEFTILLPDTGKDVAWIVAERLRTAIASMSVPWDIMLPQVTISLGIVTFDESTIIHSEEIIKRADQALYLSKERGRNRSTVWSSGLLFKTESLLREKRHLGNEEPSAVN